MVNTNTILPWQFFDAFYESLFEGVAPYVVDDEVCRGVDDQTEVINAGQTELPGCGAWLLTKHLLPENDKKGKFSSLQCFYSLYILLNFEELVKIENYSRNVAEEEDADDAN